MMVLLSNYKCTRTESNATDGSVAGMFRNQFDALRTLTTVSYASYIKFLSFRFVQTARIYITQFKLTTTIYSRVTYYTEMINNSE